MARFALSTAWHAARTRDAAELLRMPARLGFEGIELSSVDSDVTDAVDFTRRTVDFAAAIGARVVVLHLGTVEGTIPQPVIVEAMEAGLEDRWRVLLATGLAQRREGGDRHLERCLRSLETLSAHADGSGVYLGAETRYEYNDLPNLEEFGLILQTFGSRGVGYWHDVGMSIPSRRWGWPRLATIWTATSHTCWDFTCTTPGRPGITCRRGWGKRTSRTCGPTPGPNTSASSKWRASTRRTN